MIGYTGSLSEDVQEIGQNLHLPQDLSKRLPYEERVLWMENTSQVMTHRTPETQYHTTAVPVQGCVGAGLD